MANIAVMIDEQLDTTDEADPRVIASLVAQAVPSRQLRQALADALVATVREHIRRERNGVPYTPESTRPRTEGVSRRIRAADAFLRDRISVGRSMWKLLGDCTVEDLRAAAEFRRDQAKGNLANADKIDALADAVERAGKRMVKSVPLNITSSIWQA